MEKYDFALQWLDFLGNSVYNNGRQILKYDGDPTYDISPLGTKIKIGEKIAEENDEEETKYTYMSYLDFDRIGFIIKSESNPAYLWKPRQKCAYRVLRKTKNIYGITADNFYKSKIKIQHDAPQRRFRLLGENVSADIKLRPDSGVGPWIIYDDDIQRETAPRKVMTQGFSKSQLLAAMQGKYTSIPKDNSEFINIPEIPLIISDEKYVVCMPRKDTECQRIIIVGMSGYGKSLFGDAFAGRLFYSGDRVGWLIDPLNQFYNISLPQEVGQFQTMLKWINEEPKAIPALQLYLACRYNLGIVHPNISLILTQKFEEFLRKYPFYTYGIKDYDVGATIRYVNDYINDIKDIEYAQEIKDIMFNKIPNAHKDKGMQAMIYKWVNTFETIFKEKMFTNQYKNVDYAADELTVKFKDGNQMSGHPFLMAMEAGLVPVLNISSARRQRWIRNYLADLMQKIVKHQVNAGDARKRMWIIADELNEIYERGKRRDNASDSFQELYRQGRYNSIGFVGNTQSLEKLEPDMYKNANYICCVYMQDAKERKMLADFQVTKDIYEQIGDLKEMEMMIFRGPKDPFVIYDRWGRRKVDYDRKWFKGKIIPPINHHNVPGEKKQ